MPSALVSSTPASPGLASQRFTRQQRLLCASDYKSVFDDATFRVSHKYFLLLARPNSAALSRLGLVVAKKNLRRSVDRNRIKRVARNTFRISPAIQQLKLDIIFLTRRGVDELSVEMQNRVLQEGWQQLINKVNQAIEKSAAAVPGEQT